MFTRFAPREVMEIVPAAKRRALRESEDPRDAALHIAICSLERIAGADSPEGDAPEVDAFRNLRRIAAALTDGELPGA